MDASVNFSAFVIQMGVSKTIFPVLSSFSYLHYPFIYFIASKFDYFAKH